MHSLYLALFEPDLKSDGEDARAATRPQVTYEKHNERFKTFDLAVTLIVQAVAYCAHCISTVSTASLTVRQAGR
jgi:hypothetical protein